MNDRYLFKALRIGWKNLPKEEQWAQGYFIKKHGIPFIYETSECPMNSLEIYESTLCQCTGLKDKNGTLIWENDIVITPKEDGYSLICWNDTEARWEMHNETEGIVLDFDNYWSNEIEVAGNRIDNPELLEVE